MDAMLVTLTRKITASLGELAERELDGFKPEPPEEWTGRDFLDYMDRLRKATGDDFAGLGASPCPPGTSGLLIEITSRGRNLRDALDLGTRYLRIATRSVNVELEENGDEVSIVIRQVASASDPAFALSDWQLIVWHKLSQFLLGSEIPLIRTEVAHALDSSYSDYTAMLGGECLFNRPESRLTFSRSILDDPVVVTPEDARELARNKPGYFSRPQGLATTWSQSIKNMFRSQLHRDQPLSTLEQLAEQFGVCSQTLRRRLRREGNSYRKLKQEARHEMALDVLGSNDGTVAEASYAAGFAEATALTRALKSRNGMSTRELRDQVRRWQHSG